MILQKLMNDKMAQDHLSYRAAALQAGISHVTFIRISRGDPADIDILIKLCDWLKVSPSTVIDGIKSGETDLVRDLSILIERQPRLAEVFTNLLGELSSGGMTQEEVLDVINYANYKMSMRRKPIDQPKSNEVHEESRLGS